MDIICLQTADPFDYYEMLYETSITVRLYCKDKEYIIIVTSESNAVISAGMQALIEYIW
jgi:hypothetical protein